MDRAKLMQSPMRDCVLKPWHHIIGHMNVKGIHPLQNMMSDMNLTIFFGPHLCCFATHAPKVNNIGLHIQKRKGKKIKPLDIMYSNSCGPMWTTFMSGAW